MENLNLKLKLRKMIENQTRKVATSERSFVFGFEILERESRERVFVRNGKDERRVWVYNNKWV